MNRELVDALTNIELPDIDGNITQRWRSTDAYQQTTKRLASYTEADWQSAAEEIRTIQEVFAKLMDDEIPVDDQAVADAVELHRTHISKWYRECPASVHAHLGLIYTASPKFKAHIDEGRAGLADYMAAAIATSA